MISTPALNRSFAVLGVIPEPPAEFSPLAMTTSTLCLARNRGRSVFMARRPGSPTTSPTNISFTAVNLKEGGRHGEPLRNCAASSREMRLQRLCAGFAGARTEIAVTMVVKGNALLTQVPEQFDAAF